MRKNLYHFIGVLTPKKETKEQKRKRLQKEFLASYILFQSQKEKRKNLKK